MAEPPPPFNPSGPSYSGAGHKTSVTGTVYQIELLMLFMNRGLRADCIFNVATEVASAGTFDDLVFEYETGTTNGVLFLQAKHRTNLENTIREIDLADVDNGHFSVPKYFESYRRIITKKNKAFKGDNKHFVIYTPINIANDILNNFDEVSSSYVFGENDFLCFDPALLPYRNLDNYPKFLKIHKDSDLYKKMIQLLGKNTERLKVAEKLGTMIACYNAIKVEELLKMHRDWLLEKVFNGDNRTTINNKVYINFKETFLSNVEYDDILQFRRVLLQSYSEALYKRDRKKENDTEHEVIESVQKQNVIDILIKENANIEVPKTFLNSKFKKLQLSNATMAEADSFLDKLVFATNQPNNDELKKIIQQEISEMMNLVSDDSEWVESRLQSCVLEWLKAKKAHYITNENCKAFFEYVKQKFSIWSQISISLENVSQIENYGYIFSSGNLIGDIKKFLDGVEDVNILTIYYTSKLLTQIKVCQTIHSCENFIFGELKKLSQRYDTNMCPIKAFKSNSIHHIFLQVDNCSDLSVKEKELLQNITEIVKNDTNKRLVVMVAKDQQTYWENNLMNCNNQALTDLENKFSDLTEESIKKLVNNSSFGLLLYECCMECLSGDTLSEIINDNVDRGTFIHLLYCKTHIYKNAMSISLIPRDTDLVVIV